MKPTIQIKVYDLGTKKGLEEFLRDNPWMKDHQFVKTK